MEIISHLNYDAINLGEKDLLLGPTQLRALSKKFHTPFISANVFDRDNAFFMAPYCIKKFHGLKIGILGVIDEKLAAGFVDSFRVEPAEMAAKKIVAELRPRCDLIILLSHLNYERSVELAQRVNNIDLIISGHFTFREKPVRQIGQTLVVQTRQFGQSVGDLRLELNHKKIIRHEELTRPLDETVPEDSLIRARVEICERRQGIQTGSALFRRIPNQVNGYFVQAGKCRNCHAKIFDHWQSTRHAHAFDRLQGSQREDRGCLPCHTTGFEIANGFRNLRTNPELVQVQCETCHGPRFQHVRHFEAIYHQTANKISENPDLTTTVNLAICRDCHTPARDPDFDLVRGLKLITHKE